MGKIYFYLVFFFLLCSVRLSAQSYNWSKSNGTTVAAGALGREESIRDIAIDGAGNSYVIGTQKDPGNAEQIYLAKYSTTGALTWSKALGLVGEDMGLAIAATSAGDIYVTGTFTGSNNYFQIVAAGRLSSNAGTTDVFVVKFNTAGNVVWARGIGGTSTDQAADIALDTDGNVWVAANFQTNGANIDFYGAGASSRLPMASFGAVSAGLQAGLLKIAADGSFSGSDAYLFGSTGADKFRSLALDASNNIYLSGEFSNTVNFDPSGVSNLVESSPQGPGDAFIVKYSPTMALLWGGTLKGAAAEFINGLDTDASGNLYAVGSFNGFENFDLFSGSHILTSVSSSDIFIARYSGTDGSFNSVRQIGGTAGNNRANGIYVTASGDYYVTGSFSGPSANFNPGGTALNLSPTGTTDAFLAKYNSSGINSWAFRAGGSGQNGGYAVNIASDGKIIWGGFYSGSSVDFDPGTGTNTLTSLGNEDMFVASYTECTGAVIATQPLATQTVCTGQTATFTVAASGTGLTYQWQKDGSDITDGGTVSGATTATLKITGLVSGDAATYTVNVIGCTGMVTSNDAVLTVPAGPVITDQPAATQSVCAGGTATFGVTATGSGLTYQWKKDGVDLTDGGRISGATSALLNIASLIGGDADDYVVDITAAGCGAPLTSSIAALVVNSPAAITVQPVPQILCAGDPASFAVTATGFGLTYQWQKAGGDITDGGNVSGATTATLNISSTVPGDGANYTVKVTGSCGLPVPSSIVALTVNTAPAITVEPVSAPSLCAGNAASFSVTATGTGLTYQWQKDGVDVADGGTITGATSSTLDISSLVSGDAGDYKVIVSGSCGTPITSSTSTLTVNSGAAITVQPNPTQTLCTGVAAAFNVTATGTGLTYQWQLDGVDLSDGGSISGATTDQLNISSLVAGDAGDYTVNVSATGCGLPLTSAISALTVNTPINITGQPTATATLCTGNAASFSVTATGSGLTYQWQKDGVDVADGGTITGATSSTLDISSLVSGDGGDYKVIVSGLCGTPITSSTSTLTVNSGAAITVQPNPTQTLCTGVAAAFNVTATGTGLTYQWQLDGVDLSDGGSISGATTDNLNISSLVGGDAGDYTVNVSASGCGLPLTSAASVLTVNTPINITGQPTATATLCTGNAASFSVTATGSGLTYQWQKDGVDVADGGTITGATSSTLDISSLVSGDGGDYKVIVSGLCGTPITSSTSTLTVNSGAAITTEPTASQTLCEGTAASFAVVATGTGLTYQWQLDGVDLSDGGTITGATTDQLDISSLVAGDAGDYTVNVSASGCGLPLTSAASVLTVNTPINITGQPTATATLCTGNAASFSVTATGSGLTYQWQLDGVDVADGGTITGATSSTLDISSLVSGDAGDYTVIVSGLCGTPITSSTSTLTVNSGAAITVQPNPTQTLCTGVAAAFNVTATGTGLTYQWQLDGVDLSDGGTISGATTDQLNISSLVAGDAGDYTVNVSATGCGLPLTSAVSALTVNTPINITGQPTATATLCTGNAASFSVTATGSGLTYQWQLDGVDLADGGTITGATSSTLDISSLVSGDGGDYTVIVSGLCGLPVTSSTSTLTVNSGAAITVQPNPTQTLCAGVAAVFNVTATGTGLTYQWQLDGVDLSDGGTITGATTDQLDISSLVAGDAGDYRVNVSATGCGLPLTSAISTLVVNDAIVISNQPPANQILCAGQTATIDVVAAGSGLTYQWQKEGLDLTDGATISGATTTSLSISSLVAGDGGNYRLNISGACGSPVTTTTSVLAVSSSTSITMQPVDANACLGQSTNFDLTATGVSVAYQWRKNGVNLSDGGNISGANASSLVFLSVSVSDADVYDCVINSACGSPVISNTVTLTVGTGATITKQPISSVVCLGQDASFSIIAPAATSFQWQFKPAAGSYADLPNGPGVSGATTSTLIITGTQFANRGNYRCVVGGGACSGGVFSAAASLSFQSPSIASQPLSQSLCNGQIATFGVVALGNNLTYQWVKNGVNIINDGRISGAQSATLKILNINGSDQATYYCEVKGLCPPPTFSDNADLTITYCTAIEDAIDDKLFNIYPNPSTGIFHLDMDMYATGNLTYEIFNTLGEQITSAEIEGEGKVVSSIDLSSQAAGVYIIKLSYDDKRAWLRLVLEK